MHALALERIELELVLLGIVGSMELLANVVLGEEDFVNAPLFLPFHEDLNVFGFNFLQHGFVVAVLVIDNLQLLLQQRHMINLWFLFFDRRVVVAL